MCRSSRYEIFISVEMDSLGSCESFFVRVVSFDYYCTRPNEKFDPIYSTFTGAAVERVPIFRVFGSTPAGQRCCLHVHSVFPYFFLRLDWMRDLADEALDSFMQVLRLSVNQALDIAFSEKGGQYVFNMMLVRGKPFYGYHAAEEPLLKISLFNPAHVLRLADILRSGAIMDRKFELLEAHIPYKLQVCIDYNIYPMDVIELTGFSFRDPLPTTSWTLWRGERVEMHSKSQHQRKAGKLRAWLQDDADIPLNGMKRMSLCALEVDVKGTGIENARTMLREPPPSQATVPLVPSLAVLWEEERKRCGGATPVVPSREVNAPDSGKQYRETDAILRNCLDRFLEADLHFYGSQRSVGSLTPTEWLNRFQKANLIGIDVAAASRSSAAKADAAARVRVASSADEDSSAVVNMELMSQEMAQDVEALAMMAAAADDDDDDEGDEGAAARDAEDILASQAVVEQEEQQMLVANAEGEREALLEKQGGRVVQEEHEMLKEFVAGEDDAEAPRKMMEIDDGDDDLMVDLELQEEERVQDDQDDDDDENHFYDNQDDFEASAEKRKERDAGSFSGGMSGQRQSIERYGSDLFDLATESSSQNVSSLHAGERSSLRNVDRLSLSEQQESPHKRHRRLLFSGESQPDLVQMSGSSGSSFVGGLKTYRPVTRAPTVSDLEGALLLNTGLLPRKSPSTWAYFSDPKDVPKTRQKRQVGDEVLVAAAKTLPPFFSAKEKPSTVFRISGAAAAAAAVSLSTGLIVMAPAVRPPTIAQLNAAFAQSSQEQPKDDVVVAPQVRKEEKVPKSVFSQVEGPMSGTAVGGPKWNIGASDAALVEVGSASEHLLVMAVEVFAPVVSQFFPNPERDPVMIIAYCMHDQGVMGRKGSDYRMMKGVLFCKDADGMVPNSLDDVNRDVFDTELELLEGFCALLQTYDPDIIAGFEVQLSSLGFLIERAAKIGMADLSARMGRVYNRVFSRALGRMRNIVLEPQDDAELAELQRQRQMQQQQEEEEEARQERDDRPTGDRARSWNKKKTSGIQVAGRITLNLWQTLRSELSLQNYSLEACVFQVLRERFPYYTPQVLSEWYRDPVQRWRVVHHYLAVCEVVQRMLQATKIVERTSQLAKVYGIDFFSVLTRGSQYRVESVMLRITKINNYTLLSPSRKQVNTQHFPRCVPMIMEPLSNFYHDPVLVLDFQSLYPSMIIAYNLCYSTCLGIVPTDPSLARGEVLTSKLGCSSLMLPAGLLASIGSENIIVAPVDSETGVMYVKKHVRAGVLPAMLTELLESRKMVKQRMKLSADDAYLVELLDYTQLALKLLANVTYGYTSASFSGRMPCIDIADSIVGLGRRTIENAKVTVEAEWSRCKVVYGDTDSLFVLCRGMTRQEAFDVGQQISKRITAMNPAPVKLNFEKVYHPCILQSKKRYVGWKFESPTQAEGSFDAKGIETVRRDTCGVVQKILTKSLRLLFTDPDLSSIKAYLQRQFRKITAHDVLVQDFVFSKEVKLGSYAAGRVPPPAALVAEKRKRRDHRREALYKERIRYVVVNGRPKAQLYDLVIDPEEFLQKRGALTLNSVYYITKQILPALDRCFALIGVRVRHWYDELPKSTRRQGLMARAQQESAPLLKYFSSASCSVCGAGTTQPPYCASCSQHPQLCALAPLIRFGVLQSRYAVLVDTCAVCAPAGAGIIFGNQCTSLECPIAYERRELRERLAHF